MYKKISVFVFLLLLAVAQVSFLPNFFTARHIPDLVLLVLVFFTIRRGFEKIWPAAVAAGFVMDLFSFFPIGINIVSFTFTLMVVSFLSQRFLVANSNWKAFVIIFLAIAATVMNDFAISAMLKIFSFFAKSDSENILAISRDTLFKVVNNSLILMVIYWPLKKFENLNNIYGQRLKLRNDVR